MDAQGYLQGSVSDGATRFGGGSLTLKQFNNGASNPTWLTMPDAYNEDGSLPAGIPTEEEFVQMYAENRGWARVEPDEWDFFRGKSLAGPRGRSFASA